MLLNIKNPSSKYELLLDEGEASRSHRHSKKHHKEKRHRRHSEEGGDKRKATKYKVAKFKMYIFTFPVETFCAHIVHDIAHCIEWLGTYECASLVWSFICEHL